MLCERLFQALFLVLCGQNSAHTQLWCEIQIRGIGVSEFSHLIWITKNKIWIRYEITLEEREQTAWNNPITAVFFCPTSLPCNTFVWISSETPQKPLNLCLHVVTIKAVDYIHVITNKFRFLSSGHSNIKRAGIDRVHSSRANDIASFHSEQPYRLHCSFDRGEIQSKLAQNSPSETVLRPVFISATHRLMYLGGSRMCKRGDWNEHLNPFCPCFVQWHASPRGQSAC
jgi:hypothetical protein